MSHLEILLLGVVIGFIVGASLARPRFTRWN